MKRIWFGAALLIALLILGIGSTALMERAHLAPAQELVRAADLAAAEDLPGARRLVSDARRSWRKSAPLISVLADHEPMEEIEGLFAQLEIYAVTQDATSYASTCAYLARMLEALGRSHSLELQNLF